MLVLWGCTTHGQASAVDFILNFPNLRYCLHFLPQAGTSLLGAGGGHRHVSYPTVVRQVK